MYAGVAVLIFPVGDIRVAALGGFVPVPLNGKFVIGAPGSSDKMDKVAFFVPNEAGENTTLTVQPDKGATICPEQVSLSLINSEKFVPVRVTEVIARFLNPLLTTLNVCGEEVPPVRIVPKSYEAGEAEMVGDGFDSKSYARLTLSSPYP